MVRYPKNISLGISMLSAVLKRAGHEVDLIDTTFDMKDSEIASRVKRFNPDLVALSANSVNFPYATHVATLIKERHAVPTILGGVHPTIAPDESIAQDCFDTICVGEGDEALLELILSLERGEKNTAIRNIWFKEKGRIIKNAVRPLIKDLNSLPDTDFEVYDYPRYLKSHNMVAIFLGSRGCPYQCTYCINRFQQELYRGSGPYVRYRSIDRVIAEIKRTVNTYGVKIVESCDDTFTLNEDRVTKFCEKFKREIGIPFVVNARVEGITERMCRDLASSGCHRVQIGLESGDERIRKEVLRRNVSDQQIIRGARLIKKYGMTLYTYNMIGIPTETVDNIRRTINLNRQIGADAMIVSIFTAYQGTRLYELCREKGWLDTSKPLGSYYATTNVRYPKLPLRKLKHIRRWFGFWVFIGSRPTRALMELIDRRLINFAFYTRLRTLLVTKIIRPKEIVAGVYKK
jgi:radical SAM superfamily enzyme YgiQ (UPF0313 family)